MEISLNLRQLILGAAVVSLVILLALIGHAVTPVAEGSPLVLTPERWEAAALARKAGVEIVRLEADGRALAGKGAGAGGEAQENHTGHHDPLRFPAISEASRYRGK